MILHDGQPLGHTSTDIESDLEIKPVKEYHTDLDLSIEKLKNKIVKHISFCPTVINEENMITN